MRFGKKAKAVAVATVAAFALTACAEETGIVEDTSVTAAWNQALYSFNQNTTLGNATANANVLYMMHQWFNYYDADQVLQQNTDFGEYELISQDPHQVRYTLSEGLTWTDGVAVDQVDLLLHWVALTGAYNEGAAEYDTETGAIVESDSVYFDSVSIGTGVELATQLPEIHDDGRSITISYDEPLVSWEVAFANGMLPAHIVGSRALDIEDPQEAKEAVRDAIVNRDTDALGQISNFWNTGFNYTSMPADEGIVVSSGAYQVVDFVEDEYITLRARTDGYQAGPQPSVETVTVRWIPDAMSAVQALENGEVDIILPQATADVLAAAEAINGVVVLNEPEAVYEHVDLVFDNGGPFDPATYGGNEETARLVRQAFLTALDVNEVVDRLIVPLQPNAHWNQSQLFLPGAPGYEDAVASNGSEAFGQGDAQASLDLLAQAGVDTPVNVCFLYASNNTRRANIYQLFSEQVADAGFHLEDCGDERWSALLGTGTYDAASFAWQSTSTAPDASRATFYTGGGNNFNGYSSAEGDALWDELKSTFDEARQLELLLEIESVLWEDAYGMTLFQFPGVTVYNQNLGGVSVSPLSPQFFWNYWEWTAPSAGGDDV